MGFKTVPKMYIPPKYRHEDPEDIRAFVREHAFGLLISNGPKAPLATHLPLELLRDTGGEWILEGHMAKANPQWKQIGEGSEVLCIFNGPHAYVSSSWYLEEEVPTWNYMAVHLSGTWSLQSEEALRGSLKRLVDRYEADSEHPVSMEGFSKPVLRQIRGIVGFQIRIQRMEAAFKLSQGREADHPRIVEELRKRGGASAEVARRMQNEDS